LAGRFGDPVRAFTLPMVVMITWGDDPAHAALARQRGESYARMMRYRIGETFTSYGGPMTRALLVSVARERFVRREVEYAYAWWLVPHSAVSQRDLELARTALRQDWIREAADAGSFLRDGDQGPGVP
jgi:hypothetical protein